MEEPERVPVFHSRLLRTQRRRLTRPDGSSAGWLIINAADTFVTIADGFAATPDDPIARARDTDEPAVLSCGFDDPPQLSIPHQR